MVERLVIISMVVLCNVTIEHRALSMEYDRRSSGLSSAPLDMKYDNNSVEILPPTALKVNMNMDMDKGIPNLCFL